MSIYNLKTEDDAYRVTKFDDDLNVESTYHVSQMGCECPQWMGRQRTCRHMKMLPLMVERADTDWYLDFDRGEWSQPFEPLDAPEAPPPVDPGPPKAALKPSDRIRRI